MTRKLDIEIAKEAKYYIDNCSTMRDTADYFGVSKTKIHVDITKKLPKINTGLYMQAVSLINENIAIRNIKGGMATKRKYARLKKEGKKCTMIST